MRRYLLLGAGVASITAAETIRSLDEQGEILMVTSDRAVYYSRPGLAYYLTNEIPEKFLFPITGKDLSRLGVKLLIGRATAIHPQEHVLELDDRRRLPYDRLLVATGSRAAMITLPGSQLEGVAKLDDLADARRILQMARRGRSAVVIGGGITALELVEGLHSRGVHVHYFMRGARYWSNVLDETESIIIEKRLQQQGVILHYNTESAAILGQKSRVAGVLTKPGERVACEMVMVAIGVLANKELAEASGLKTERGVLVNEMLETSAADIFAAGDVAQVFDPASGKTLLDTLWNTARQQGKIAGLNMAGKVTPYRKSVSINITRLAGLTTTIIGMVGHGHDENLVGIARGDSETWRQLPDAVTAQSNFEINRLRILVGERRLLGAVVMGEQSLSRPLFYLIDSQADIQSERARLLASPKPGEVICDLWENWRSHAAITQQ